MVEKKNSKIRLVCGLLMIALVLVAVVIWFLLGTHWLHRVANSIAPNGTRKYEIYDLSLDSTSQDSKKDIVTLREYERKENSSKWRRVSETELAGKYVGGYWSEDSRVFVLSLSKNENNLYLFDNENGNMRNLDNFLDMKLIGEAAFNSKLYRSMLSEEDDIHYEFVQWAKQSDWMLIRYSVLLQESESGEKENSELSGYFWYDYNQNSLKGLVETEE